MSRILGIDPGTVRLGLALSDPGGRIAAPLATLVVDGGEVEEIATLVLEHEVETVVVGHPRKLDGTRGDAALAAEALAEQIGARTGLPVDLWDERLTSVQAERGLIAQGAKRRARREGTDRVAAAIILQSYLDAKVVR